MMNPLWVDARDYLTSQGQPVTTGGLNQAMNLLASNPQLRPSAVKAGGGAAGIAAGLGAPTDQIVQTPLAPPASQGIIETPLPPPAVRGGSPSPPTQRAGRGSNGASSGSRTAGGTSASGATPKAGPDKSGRDRSMVQFPVWKDAYGRDQKPPMGGYTPPTPGSSAPSAPAAPSGANGSPVGMAQAGTGGDDPGLLAHLMHGDYNGRLAALGGAGASVLAALLMGRGGNEAGSRPINSREGEVIPPDRMTVYGQGSAEGPIINGDPIQELLGKPDTTDYGAMHGGPTYGPEDYGASNGRDSDAPLNGADEAYGSAVQRAHNALPGPQTFEDMIAQLAANAPRGGALPPPAARPPIQMPNQTSGPTINMPPTGGTQLMDLLRGLIGQ